MTTTEVKTMGRQEAYGKMLELIRSTHWGKEALACPVFEKKRVRIHRPDTFSGWGYQMVNDTEKGPIKHVYCLIGLLIKALDFPVSGEYETDGTIEETGFRERVGLTNAYDLVRGLFEQLPDWETHLQRHAAYQATRMASSRSERDLLGFMVSQLESWNDEDERVKQEVEDLIQRAYDVVAAA